MPLESRENGLPRVYFATSSDAIPNPPTNETVDQAITLHKKIGRPFEKGNKAHLYKRPVLASRYGIPIDAKDPVYKKTLRNARMYYRRRVKELSLTNGGEISAGVCGILASAARDLAASIYTAQLASQNGDVSLMLTSSKFAHAARQGELTAIEIAARESIVAKRIKTSHDLLNELVAGPPARSVLVSEFSPNKRENQG